MRYNHILAKIRQQETLSKQIVNAIDDLHSVREQDITRQRVETRFKVLSSDWEEFAVNDKAINTSIFELTAEESIKIDKCSYFLNQTHKITRDAFLEAHEKMTALLDKLTPPSTPVSTFSLESQQPVQVIAQSDRLPKLDIPTFNGDPAEWLPFKDMFTSMVIKDKYLDPVIKLHFLKNHLVGTAAALLKHTASIEGNFEKAWSDIVSYYDNKRRLINSALQSFTSLERITKESASELETFYSTVNQILRTLESLGQPIDTWDSILIFLTVQRLDKGSIRSWELEVGDETEYPSWERFNKFLKKRIRSLQAVELSLPSRPDFQSNKKQSNGKSSHNNSSQQKNHYSNSDKARPSQSARSFNASFSKCPICSNSHYVLRCPDYTSKTTAQRTDIVKRNHLCFNCLGDHHIKDCKSLKRCQKCGKKHHTTLHRFDSNTQRSNSDSKQNNSSKENSLNNDEKQVNHVSCQISSPSTSVLLATALVQVVSKEGYSIEARALIDQGSEVSLASENLVQMLHLPRQNSKISIVGVGAQPSGKTKGSVSFLIRPHFKSNTHCNVTAYVLPKLTAGVSSTKADFKSWSHLNGIKLADPQFMKPGPVDIIIGADIFAQIIENDLKKGQVGQPIAQKTTLGWIISGPVNSQSQSSLIHGYHCSIDKELLDSIERFWRQEESFSSKLSLSPADQECEDHFKSTHSRSSNGKYIVRLPFKNPKQPLGGSKRTATKMLNRTFLKFNSNKTLYEAYNQFLKEYENLGHMALVSVNKPEPSQCFYLPHHGVLRESSLTTKLRVVFNGSSRSSNGVSLNDTLHTGAKLQIDLIDVLIWLRQFQFVFASDIEKMYRQIMVHPDDWDYQRILWKDPSNNIQTYQLTTVTYGLGCAPFLALRALNQLVDDEGKNFPLAIPCLTKGRYVDDVFGGADSVEQLQQIVQQVDHMCMAGGFPLQKWISNDPSALKKIPTDRQLPQSALELNESHTIHTLGLSWQPSADTFHFKVKAMIKSSITKRSILSQIATLFDPLGLISPVIIRAKILIQELWAIKLGWDDPVPEITAKKWTDFVNQLSELSQLSIPRWIGITQDASIQIHGFSDASQAAMGAVTYVRAVKNGIVTTTLLCAKTKVSPLKRMTIPRLELTAATLLAKLVSHVLQVLNLTDIPVYLWTDSSIVFTWINNHPSRWKEYVHNRVCYIQESLPQAQWRFIPGVENPADCASRGITPAELAQFDLWWHGPHWLTRDSADWPSEVSSAPITESLEEKTSQVHLARQSSINTSWNLLDRYSSLTKLLRITALCQRVILRFKHKLDKSLTSPLTPDDLEIAKQFWVSHVQKLAFSKEISIIASSKQLPRHHPLARLTPFLDKQNLLRVGGRLQNSILNYQCKHPIILPKDSNFSKLIIADAHTRTLHGSTQVTLSFIRGSYWIMGGRAPVRSYIHKCLKCFIYRKSNAQQLMGQLPASRVTPTGSPFFHTGIDYAGPINLKTWSGRAARHYKAYICLFVCLTTSAVHLELVTDYTAEAFLAAYRRFTARRGICKTLSSDCGTNLKGADAELQRLFSSASKELGKLAQLIANDGTEWKFNPPAAPHFGGKWEAGVKSVKFHLKRVIGDTTLTYEEMSTLLTQIEAVLNSRPLCPLSDDPDDLATITPGHFIIGRPLNLVPEPSLEDLKCSRLSRWQHLRQMLNSFWSKWSKECLQRYQTIYKWNQQSDDIKLGSLVLIIDERYPPIKWPKGRIINLHPGKDGLVRVVDIKTENSTLTRPIAKLCPLPIVHDTL